MEPLILGLDPKPKTRVIPTHVLSEITELGDCFTFVFPNDLTARHLSRNELSPRSEILHQLDTMWLPRGNNSHPEIFNTRIRAALRRGDYKIITGVPYSGLVSEFRRTSLRQEDKSDDTKK